MDILRLKDSNAEMHRKKDSVEQDQTAAMISV